jgi:hypothetical protein
MDISPIAPPFPCLEDSRTLLFRVHAGYGFRLRGNDAQNDGILGQMDIAYRSAPFAGRFSIESGSSMDFFGETEHLAAYLQLNYHASQRFTLSLRGFGGGVQDDREASPAASGAAADSDRDDLGGIVQTWILGEYRIDPKFSVGAAVGMDWQIYGNGGGDQGTQMGLVNFLNLAYRL